MDNEDTKMMLRYKISRLKKDIKTLQDQLNSSNAHLELLLFEESLEEKHLDVNQKKELLAVAGYGDDIDFMSNFRNSLVFLKNHEDDKSVWDDELAQAMKIVDECKRHPGVNNRLKMQNCIFYIVELAMCELIPLKSICKVLKDLNMQLWDTMKLPATRPRRNVRFGLSVRFVMRRKPEYASDDDYSSSSLEEFYPYPLGPETFDAYDRPTYTNEKTELRLEIQFLKGLLKIISDARVVEKVKATIGARVGCLRYIERSVASHETVYLHREPVETVGLQHVDSE